MNNSRNSAASLILELDGDPDQLSTNTTIAQVAFLKKALIRAKQEPTSPRGKTLRETGQVRIIIGTTGRAMAFGHVDPAADEIARASMWRTTISEALDALSLVIRFGHFIADIQAISQKEGGEAFHARQKMVEVVAASGGLSWDREKLPLARSVGKIFKEWKAYCQEFNAWQKEIAAFKKAEAEAAAKAAAVPTVDEVTIEMAKAIGGEVGTPAPTKVESQESRLQAVGALEVVPESAPAPATKFSDKLNGMSPEELAQLIAAAQQMQAQGANN